MKILGRRGDTIVEVLIALVITASTIGVAYGITTRSANTIRDSQERVEALKVAESQVEHLRYLTSIPSDIGSLYDTDLYSYCIHDDNTISAPMYLGTIVFNGHNDAGPPDNIDNAILDASNPADKYVAPGCVFSNLYHASIYYSPPSSDVFFIQVRWNRIGGGKNEVELTYKIHPNV